MNVSSSQLPLSLPERRSVVPGTRAPLVQAVVAPAPRSLDSDVFSKPSPLQGDLQRLGRYSSPNRGGLMLYALTGSDGTPAAGARVDVRI